MSEKIKDGGPAFPNSKVTNYLFEDEHIKPILETKDGMTLRDWFAGQALSGMLSVWPRFTVNSEEFYASNAYEIADAMLLEREKQ